MSRFAKTLSTLAAVALLFFRVGTVFAQVVPTTVWIPNFASSTITPRPSNLQIPCANIVGGCSSGAGTTTVNGVAGPTITFNIVSTSSPSSITTSSANLFLNLLAYTSSSDITVTPTGTIVFTNHNISQFTNNSGYGTSNISTSSANTWSQPQTINSTITSNIQVLNSEQHIPSNYATAGCFGSAGTTDLGACINLAYNNVSSTASATPIYVPSIGNNINFSTGLVFGNNGEYVNLICPAGETLTYTGSGPATTWNEGDGAFFGSYHVAHTAGNCTILGGSSAATTATTTGAIIGGTNGEAGLDLSNMTFANFGTGVRVATGTYMFTLSFPVLRGNVANEEYDTASNSGESIKVIGGAIVDCGNSSALSCIKIDSSAVASAEFIALSMDDAQLSDSTANSTVVVAYSHLEDPTPSTYDPYDFITIANSSSDHFDLTDNELMHDASGTQLANEYVSNGAFTTAVGDTFESNHGSSSLYAFNETNGTSSVLVAIGIKNKNGGFLGIDSTAIGSTISGPNIGAYFSVGAPVYVDEGLLVGGKLFAQTTFANVASTTTETSLIGSGVGTTTIAANMLQAGSVIHISMGGVIAYPGSVATSSFTFFLGSSAITSTIPTLPVNGSSNPWTLTCDITIQTGGTSGIWAPNCFAIAPLNAGNGNAESWLIPVSTPTSSVNTTAANKIDVQYKWYGATSTAYSVTSTQSSIIVYP